MIEDDSDEDEAEVDHGREADRNEGGAERLGRTDSERVGSGEAGEDKGEESPTQVQCHFDALRTASLLDDPRGLRAFCSLASLRSCLHDE